MSAYITTNSVPMSSLPTTSGVVQPFLVSTTNTGSSTFAPDGLAAAPIFGLGGAALQGGEIVAGGIATLVSYVGTLLNSGSLCWILFNCTGGAQQVAAATGSQQAAQAGQVAAGSFTTATAGGTANAITASFPASPTAFSTGQSFTIISSTTNTGAVTATLTLGGTAQASIPVVKANNQAISAGDFPAGYPGEFNYSAAFGALVLQNPATSSASGEGRLLNTIYYSVVAQTVTISIASPGVVTFANAASLPLANAPIVFASTGALPTGITAGTTYYVKNPSGTTANISSTLGGTAIATTGTQSGTQTVANPAYLKATKNPSFIITEVWGGGGGSGGVGVATAGTGGGGAGGYARQKILSASLSASETITIGAGGTAGTNAPSNGGSGGTSSFGAHSSATGGGGTAAINVSGATSAGAGGTGSGGDLNLTGAGGVGPGISNSGIIYAASGAGGATTLGGNGASIAGITTPGLNAVNGSGSGASGSMGTSAQTGGTGGSGFVIVYEYS